MSSFDLLADHIRDYIHDPGASWMCGRFGAVAEFHRDLGEPVEIATEPAVAAATARGAVRLKLLPELRPVAYETVNKCMTWGQGVALCLPEPFARMGGRAVVAELGPDRDAIRVEDRDALLFDLGLGGRYTEICVRTSDPETVGLLRAIVGKPLFAEGGAFLGRLPTLSPHRVFRSRLGRVEVYQPVPPPDGKSPEGPHTHVVKRLLALRRYHAATVPVPEGCIAGMTLYPAHPLHQEMGAAPRFDTARYDAFQELLKQYGDPALLAGKQAAHRERAGEADAAANLTARAERIGFRIGQRQLKWL